jgi:hypothetical protein
MDIWATILLDTMRTPADQVYKSLRKKEEFLHFRD